MPAEAIITFPSVINAPNVYALLISSPCFLFFFHTPTSSPINLLIIVQTHIPKSVDTTPLSFRGPCKVVTSHISIIVIIVVTVPLRSFALSLAFRIYLPSGCGSADGFGTLRGCCWVELACLAGSWDSGGSGEVCKFLRAADAFKGVAHPLVVLKFFGTI